MKRKTVVYLLCGAAALAAASWAARGRAGRTAAEDELWAPVREGPLVVSVESRGEIAPSSQIMLKSAVEGRASILYLIPEGTFVEEGTLLVELDVASKLDERAAQAITLQNAESASTVQKEELEITRNQAASDVESAEQDLRFAREDLVKYEEGEYPTTLNEKKGNVALAEQELEQAREKYEWSKKLHAENFLSETELAADELSWKHARLSLETARGNLALLENYTHKREKAKLESDVRQKEQALERVRRKAASSIVQAESQLRAKEAEATSQRQRFEKLERQIAAAKIVAPRAGQVVYATSAQRGWGRQEPLKEGQEVWERQDLILLPTADTFVAKVNVPESALPVRVRCEALPDRVFQGALSFVSPMPDNERRWMNPDLKEYPAQIRIDGGVGELKTGMGCTVEIIAERFDRALYAPLQSVVRVDGAPCVWVRGPGGAPERRAVETGADNNRFVRILSGLRAGDEVLLAPPLAASEAKEEAPAP